MAKIDIKINDQVVSVAKDSTLLDAIKSIGVTIPTLCYHKDLTPNGSCRLCLVEIEERGKKKMVTACNFPVRGEISVSTTSEKVIKNRKTLAEMYLGRWPNVEVVQWLADKVGVTGTRFKSDMTDENPKACILCGRCVTACKTFIQEEIIDFAGRGMNRNLNMPFGEVDPHCIGCTSCAYVCPTGAIEISDDVNKPKNPKLIQKHGMKVNAEMANLDDNQFRMRQVGTANIVEVMDAYDLLPVHNYQYGKHKDTHKIDSKVLKEKYLTQGTADACWKGCSMACAKAVDGFELKSGPYKGDKVCVDGPEYETSAACANMGCFDGDFVIEYNFYCDTYGIDTISVGTCVAFVMECYENGIITKEDTGGKELNFGAVAETLELMHEMARGEGFGVEVGQGVRYLKEKWSAAKPEKAAFMQDIGMEVKGLEFSEYVSKESLAQQAGFAMAQKGPQHDEAWLIFNDQINNLMPSFEDKATALYYYPLFRTWFGLLGLCKIVWNDVVPEGNKKHIPTESAKIPEHVENYRKFFEGMTGIELDEKKMLDQSARVFNLQRVMSRMLGKSERHDDRPPYRAVGPVTKAEYESRDERYDKQLKEIVGFDPEGKSTEEKMAALRAYREDQYEQVMDAAYVKRGWTSNGVPKVSRLQELGIDLPELVAIVEGDME